MADLADQLATDPRRPGVRPLAPPARDELADTPWSGDGPDPLEQLWEQS